MASALTSRAHGCPLESAKQSSQQSDFPAREHDLDDYLPGEEPWIAGFLRQWATEYVAGEGEVKEGWGDWTKKRGQTDQNWEWPYKRILTHRRREDGKTKYLVKWVGERYFPSWIEEGQLGEDGRAMYDEAHGVTRENHQEE